MAGRPGHYLQEYTSSSANSLSCRPSVPDWLIKTLKGQDLVATHVDYHVYQHPNTRSHSYIVTDEYGQGKHVCSVKWDVSSKQITVNNRLHTKWVDMRYWRDPEREVSKALLQWILTNCMCSGCKMLRQDILCPNCKCTMYCTTKCMRKHKNAHLPRCRQDCLLREKPNHDNKKVFKSRNKDIIPLQILPLPKTYSIAEKRELVRQNKNVVCLLDLPLDLLEWLLREYTDVVMYHMLAETCRTFRKMFPLRVRVRIPHTLLPTEVNGVPRIPFYGYSRKPILPPKSPMVSFMVARGYFRLVDRWYAIYSQPKHYGQVDPIDIRSGVLTSVEATMDIIRRGLIGFLSRANLVASLAESASKPDIYRLLLCYTMRRSSLGMDLVNHFGRNGYRNIKKQHKQDLKAAVVNGDLPTLSAMNCCGWIISRQAMRVLEWKIKSEKLSPLLGKRLEMVEYLKSRNRWL